MTTIAVVCLPDSQIALPFSNEFAKGGSSLVPTKSYNKGAKQPAWIFITSEELETDSEDYNRLKEKFTGFSTIEDGVFQSNGDDGYMERLQVLIMAAFRNLELDPNFKDKSGS